MLLSASQLEDSQRLVLKCIQFVLDGVDLLEKLPHLGLEDLYFLVLFPLNFVYLGVFLFNLNEVLLDHILNSSIRELSDQIAVI